MNAKKQSRCRNAALMEYIGTLYTLCFSDNVKEGDSSSLAHTGEQPVYCAEHIEQDPDSLYCKCKAPYRDNPHDNKVKPVVLAVLSLMQMIENGRSAKH
jgi:hypothetical protein